MKTHAVINDVLVGFSKLIWTFCNKRVFSQPINSFIDLGKCAMLLERAKIDYIIHGRKRSNPWLLTAKPNSVIKITKLFKIFDAEAIVFFPAGEKRMVPLQLLVKLRQSSKYGGQYERPYLETVNGIRFFIFFAKSHMSLEIMGTNNSIIECFLKVVNQGKSSWSWRDKTEQEI